MIRLQTDIGRQGKVLAIAAAAVLVVGAYVAWTYHGAATARSSVAPVQTGHGTPAPESEHYGNVLGRYNRRKADEAERKDTSYLSVLSSRARAVPESSASAAVATTAASTAATAAATAPTYAAQPLAGPTSVGPTAHASATPAPATVHAASYDPKAAERLADQLQALMAGWSTVAHAEARSSEPRNAPAASPVASKAPATIASPTAPHSKLVEDLEPIPAVLDTEIDTDETSMVFAHASSGTYAGAVFVAQGYKRLNNTVDMTFTLMKWRGKTYKIEAKAIDLDSMRSALSGEVSHHYWSRIVIPSLALGLGRTGQLYEKADTESTVSPYGVVQSSTGSPTGKIVTGTVVGGAAQQAGQVLTQDAAQLSAKQVVVARNSAIGIVLLAPVYADADVGPAAPAPANAHAVETLPATTAAAAGSATGTHPLP